MYQPTFLNILAKLRALEALSLISTNSSLKRRQESPMASLRGGGTVSKLNCTTLHDSSPHLLLSGFSPEVWRIWQHSSIRVSRLSPVHSRRCAAMSLWWRRRWQREGTLTEPGQAYTFAPSSFPPLHSSLSPLSSLTPFFPPFCTLSPLSPKSPPSLRLSSTDVCTYLLHVLPLFLQDVARGHLHPPLQVVKVYLWGWWCGAVRCGGVVGWDSEVWWYGGVGQ